MTALIAISCTMLLQGWRAGPDETCTVSAAVSAIVGRGRAGRTGETVEEMTDRVLRERERGGEGERARGERRYVMIARLP